MKKRMFLTTVLMTLVLLLAVTTATFAWYQASASNGIDVQDNKYLASTTNQDITVGNVQATVVWDTENAVACKELTNAAGQTYYIVNGKKVLKTTDVVNTYGVLKIKSITLDLDGMASDMIASLAGTYTVTVVSTEQVQLTLTQPNGAVADNQTVSFEITISTAGVVTSTLPSIYYAVRNTSEGVEQPGQVGKVSVSTIVLKTA